MATITASSMQGSGAKAVTIATLTASDTFEFVSGSILVLNNVTAGALTPNIVGDAATTVQVAGVGAVDVSAGYTFASIAADDAVVVRLDTIREYLTGTIALTGADAMEAILLTP